MAGLLQARRPSDAGSPGLADPRLLAFARGVSIGALIGAAIAGSTLWSRLRRR